MTSQRTVTLTLPHEAVSLLWLAVASMVRSPAATFNARERAGQFAAVLRELMNGSKTEGAVPDSAHDASIQMFVSRVQFPTDRPPHYFRAKFTRLDGSPLSTNAECTFEEPASWALLERIRSHRMPIPYGVGAWLTYAPVGGKLKAWEPDREILCSFEVIANDKS